MKVYINNKIIETKENFTILQLCSKIGIEIPRFCYHSRLSIAANCRMCLIQVEDSVKPIASCAMGLTDGIRVHTNTTLVKRVRESVLEFLLINHPLDCPICDQGGECDLQDQTLVFGSDRGRFYEKKRAVKDFYAGPLIKTFMTRCIHCTRCVRYNTEIEKNSTFGALGRGQEMRIGFFIKKPLNSPLSGNLVDICPVGALTSKPYAFTSRPWELRTVGSIDCSDNSYSKIRLDIRGQEIMRILPLDLDSKSGDWISDKSRFMFDGLKYQRLLFPFFKEKGLWKNLLYLLNKKFIYDFLFLNKKLMFIEKILEFESFIVLWSFFFQRKKKAVLKKKAPQNYKNILIYKSSCLTENVIFFNKLLTIQKKKILTLGVSSNLEFPKLGILENNIFLFFKGKLIPFISKDRFFYFSLKVKESLQEEKVFFI